MISYAIAGGGLALLAMVYAVASWRARKRETSALRRSAFDSDRNPKEN